MKIRAKFKKFGSLKYISHLELMNTLQRAFRRAKLPLAYSRGYNPHPRLSMGMALSVGLTGLGEYFDVELEQEIEPGLFIKRANKCLPHGLEILRARKIPDRLKSLMAQVDTAMYRVEMDFDGKIDGRSIIKDFLSRQEIRIIRKRRKKKDKEINIRPLIKGIEIEEDNIWLFTVSTGSRGNLRIEELIRALVENYNNVNEVPLTKITRIGLYVTKNGNLYELIDDHVVEADS